MTGLVRHLSVALVAVTTLGLPPVVAQSQPTTGTATFFILQNGDSTTIHILWGQFSLPLGVALLFAAIGGAVLVATVGAARILQLRRQAKRLTGRPSTSSPARRES